MQEEGITVAQACQRLGVSERTLRRLLRRPELQAKLLAVNRRIGGRDRQVILVSSSLLSHLKTEFVQEQQSAEYASSNQQAATGNNIYFAYERLLAEKDARIAELTAALAYERAQPSPHTNQTAGKDVLYAADTLPLWKRLLGLRR